MPTLKPRRRPKIIRVSASSAAALIACSAAVPISENGVVSKAPAAAEAVLDETISTAPPSAAEKRTAEMGKHHLSQKRKHGQTTAGGQVRQEKSPSKRGDDAPQKHPRTDASIKQTKIIPSPSKANGHGSSGNTSSKDKEAPQRPAAASASLESTEEVAIPTNNSSRRREPPPDYRRWHNAADYKHDLLMKMANGTALSEDEQRYVDRMESQFLSAGAAPTPSISWTLNSHLHHASGPKPAAMHNPAMAQMAQMAQIAQMTQMMMSTAVAGGLGTNPAGGRRAGLEAATQYQLSRNQCLHQQMAMSMASMAFCSMVNAAAVAASTSASRQSVKTSVPASDTDRDAQNSHSTAEHTAGSLVVATAREDRNIVDDVEVGGSMEDDAHGRTEALDSTDAAGSATLKKTGRKSRTARNGGTRGKRKYIKHSAWWDNRSGPKSPTSIHRAKKIEAAKKAEMPLPLKKETKPRRKYSKKSLFWQTERKAKDANNSINSPPLGDDVEGGNDVMDDDAYELSEALEAYKRGDKDYVWAEEPDGGAASLKPGDTILFLFEWGWERGNVHSTSKCTKTQKTIAKGFDIPVLVRYVIDGDYILQDFGEVSSYLSRKDFEKLRSREEEDPSEIGLKSWCVIKLENR